MHSKIYIDKEGNISGLADDLLDKLDNVGEKTVKRVSDVEYAHEYKCWVARDLGGREIARDKIRSEVIAKERAHFNKAIEDAFNAAVLL